MPEYLLNCWYAAAFGDEVANAPLARQLLGEDIVLYRGEEGTPIALQDRCPHRFAPLSMGKVRGDALQCPYHGLEFGTDGGCVRNPHAKNGAPLAAAKVRSYPTLEQYGLIWIWPGEQALADPSALPAVAFLNQPDRFRVVKGRLHVQGNYQLIVDNLLDLSHASFIHPQFAASGVRPEQALAATTTRLERGERSFRNYRLRSGLPAAGPSQRLFGVGNGPCNSKTHMTWHPPALLDFDAGTWREEEAEEDGAHIPQLHAITPETEFSSHYFFLNGRNRRREDAEVDDALLEMFDLAFARQDEPMIEAVQRRMGVESDINKLRPLMLPTDAAPVFARRLLARLIEEERAARQPDAAQTI